MKIVSRVVSLFSIVSRVALLCLLSLTLMSCEVAMLAGGNLRHFDGAYSIQLANSHPDLLDAIAAVGKEMGLEPSMINAAQGQISISNGGGSIAATAVVGTMSTKTISCFLTDGGRTLNLQIIVDGNFSYGTKEAADKLFAEFRNKLLEKVGEAKS